MPSLLPLDCQLSNQEYGFAEFHRHFLAESQRKGLVLDIRWNEGQISLTSALPVVHQLARGVPL
jgi:hypothetical protein